MHPFHCSLTLDRRRPTRRQPQVVPNWIMPPMQLRGRRKDDVCTQDSPVSLSSTFNHSASFYSTLSLYPKCFAVSHFPSNTSLTIIEYFVTQPVVCSPSIAACTSCCDRCQLHLKCPSFFFRSGCTTKHQAPSTKRQATSPKHLSHRSERYCTVFPTQRKHVVH